MTLAAKIVQRYKLSFTPPRAIYLPNEVRNKPPLVPEGTDLAIWTWEDNGKVFGIAFQGKANKPIWNFRFRSESERQRQIDETANRRRTQLQGKADAAKERKEFVHPYKVGDIFYTSWGYDQTNVDFYEVVEVKGKTLKVREIGGKVDNSSQGTDYVVPAPGKFEGPALTVRPTGKDSVKVDGHTGWLWKGKPVYQTGFGYGH